MLAKKKETLNASKLRDLVHDTGQNYFIDWSSEDLPGIGTVEHWKIALTVFGQLGKKNTLYIGSPGNGKTTLAEIVSAQLSGLPYDLFDALKIQGHPDQTKDTMLARIDFGRLAEEGVVFQPTMYLPSIIIDEMNRLTPGRQSVLLDYVRTGTVEHLGKALARGKLPFFATNNYNGPGTYPLSAAMYDRFHICLELGRGSCFMREHIKRAEENLAATSDPKLTEEILKMLLNKDLKIEERLQRIASYERFDGSTVVKAANALPVDKEALTLLRCVWEEMNMSPLYGELREVDPSDLSTHAKEVASVHLKTGMSQRAWSSAEFYARMLAVYTESGAVNVEHVRAVLPFCLSHRIEFREDYAAKFNAQQRLRGEHKSLDLTRRLLGEIRSRLEAPSGPRASIDTLDAYVGKPEDPELAKRAKEIAERPEPDHPLLKAYWHAARELLKERSGNMPSGKTW